MPSAAGLIVDAACASCTCDCFSAAWITGKVATDLPAGCAAQPHAGLSNCAATACRLPGETGQHRMVPPGQAQGSASAPASRTAALPPAAAHGTAKGTPASTHTIASAAASGSRLNLFIYRTKQSRVPASSFALARLERPIPSISIGLRLIGLLQLEDEHRPGRFPAAVTCLRP